MSLMTVDVNMWVRYQTSSTVYRAEVRKIQNASLDRVDLMVYPTIGYVQNIPRSANGVTPTDDTWSYALGANKY